MTSDRPEAASPQVAHRLSLQRRLGTDPEVQLRKALHRRGYRYRLHAKVPARPRRTVDITFPKQKVAVFVDGCFWHACPDHATWPSNNAAWWRAKLETNIARDRDTDAALAEAGWLVVRVWEHEAPEEAADRVIETVRRRRGAADVGGTRT